MLTYYIFAGKLDLQDRHRFDKRVSSIDLKTDSTPKINWLMSYGR